MSLKPVETHCLQERPPEESLEEDLDVDVEDLDMRLRFVVEGE